MNQPLAHSTTSNNPIKDFLAEIRELGRDEALGKDALPKLALKVIDGIETNVINLDKDQDGKDDIDRVYTDYVEARGKKSIHEHTAGGLKSNTSKLRQIAVATAMPSADFAGSINQLIEKREEMLAEEHKVRPCYHAIVEAARTQIDQPGDLTPDQIKELILRPEAEEKTAEKVLRTVEKQLADLISGEKGPKCQEQAVIDAHQKITEQLAAFGLQTKTAATLAAAAELGLTLVTPTGNAQEGTQVAA